MSKRNMPSRFGRARSAGQFRTVLVAVLFLGTPPLSAQSGTGELNLQDRNDDEESQKGQVEEPAGASADYEKHGDDFSELSLAELMAVDVVVTASRRAQPISTVPYAVSVIAAEDIRQSGARSVPDALRLAPGVDVAALSFSNAAVSTRGFHGFLANQVLVLVDGRQIYDSFFGGTVWGAWPFQLEDIERIEVIRGPGGVIWGANAANGVINIITKDPAEQLGVTVTSRGGSRGSFKQHIGYGFREGDLRLRISGEYEGSDGFNDGGSILRSLEDDYRGGRLSLHAVYEKDKDSKLTISAGSGVVDGGFPPTPLAGFGLRRNSESQVSFLMGQWDRRTETGGQIQVTGFVNDYQASPGFPAVDYRYQKLGLSLRYTYEPDDTRTRTWGFDTRADLFDSGNSDPDMLSKSFVGTGILGVYLQEEWRFAPRWSLNLGGRLDYEFYGGFQPSARASLSYELSENAHLFAAVSRAFHMPTAAGRFAQVPMLNGLAYVTANRDSDPTTLVAYELGYRGRHFDRLDTSVNLFWHEYDEATTISPRLGPPGLLQYRFDNRAGNVSLYGVEADVRYKATSRLTLLGAYTFQQLNWDVTEWYTDRDYITPPKHKFMVGARYAVNDDLSLSSHLYYVDAVRAPNPTIPFLPLHVDPYFRLDIRAEQEFWDDRASISVGVANLLDSGHREGGTLFLNDAEVPLMIFAEVRLRIR